MGLQKGILIVIEGIDGSGKSTQADMLLHKLQVKGFDAVYFREPSDSEYGREIKRKSLYPDSLSPEQELKLFQKDREENVKRNLKPSLERNKVVILDRYYFSTIAYQGAKGIDKERIRKMNKFALQPDLVFILDIDPEEGLKRIKNRKKKDRLFEREDYLAKVRDIFKSFKGERFIHIDAKKSAEKISKEMERIVLDTLNKKGE